MRFGLTTAVLGLAVAAAGPAAVAEAFWPPRDFGTNNPMLAVAAGDSITVGIQRDIPSGLVDRPYPAALQGLLAAAHPDFVVRTRGLGGESTGGGLARLSAVLSQDQPGFVLIMEGTNDASGGEDPGIVAANLRAMIRLAKANSTLPVLGAIPPNFRDDPDAQAILARVNALLPGVAASEDVRFVDTFYPLDDPSLYGVEDLLHPNQRGYDVLAAAWQPAVSQAIDASRALLGGVAVAGVTPPLSSAPLGRPGPPSREQWIVTGVGPGGLPQVRLFRGDNTAVGPALLPYPPGFLGGVRGAACDVDGDGVDDVVAGAGFGGGPNVTVIELDATGAPVAILASFYAFNPAFTGGVFVACGDIDGDGRPDIVAGAGRDGGPHARAFRYAPGQPGGVADAAVSFFAYDPRFTGGVEAAAGNLDGDGRAELITGTGPGGGPHVRILRRDASGAAVGVADFFAYVPEFRGGVFVGVVGAQVVTGTGPGGGPHVRGFTVEGVPTAVSFFAYRACILSW